MKFRTALPEPSPAFTLDPHCPVLTLGSCFADNIAAAMRQSLWRAVNPFGVLYNPISIAAALRGAINPDHAASLIRPTLFRSQGLCRSILLDSSFADFSPDACVARYVSASLEAHEIIKSAQAICITFGTAWAYAIAPSAASENRHDAAIPRAYLLHNTVGNCHKLPADRFVRYRLTINEITECWHDMAKELLAVNPSLHLIFTVSPVRHLKDGFAGNTRSKAILALAAEELAASIPGAVYFPAFEALNDDLRDYRFYNEDMTHPSPAAVNYIWEYFRKSFLNDEGEKILREGEKMRRRLEHRPLLPRSASEASAEASRLSEEYAEFCRRHQNSLLDISSLLPHTGGTDQHV